MHKGRWRRNVWAFALCSRALAKQAGRHQVISGKAETLGLRGWDLTMEPTHSCLTGTPSQTLKLLRLLGPGGTWGPSEQVGAGVRSAERHWSLFCYFLFFFKQNVHWIIFFFYNQTVGFLGGGGGSKKFLWDVWLHDED